MSDQTKVEQKESVAMSQGADGGKQETTERQQPREGTGRNKKQERGKKQREHTLKENPMPKTAGAIFETCKLEF